MVGGGGGGHVYEIGRLGWECRAGRDGPCAAQMSGASDGCKGAADAAAEARIPSGDLDKAAGGPTADDLATADGFVAADGFATGLHDESAPSDEQRREPPGRPEGGREAEVGGEEGTAPQEVAAQAGSVAIDGLLQRRVALLLANGHVFNWIESHSEFLALIDSCQRAIDEGVAPERIPMGSSGSYFIKDAAGRIVGVFKPKDEEPYGQLNPKWTKWLHRTCCPCLFGRSFLMPSTGYVSEAAASLVDSFLNLRVVPRTQVGHLSSAVFVYPWWEHYRVWSEAHPASSSGDEPSPRDGPFAPSQAAREAPKFPLKLGSFQLFVEGFEESAIVLDRLEQMRPLPSDLQEAFQLEFERMTILDYAIRNTDRSMDNWLVHISYCTDDAFAEAISDDPQAGGEEGKGGRSERVRVKIACIDNGLAFPFKHPNELRSYPFSWAGLPQARIPYSSRIRDDILPILSDTTKWEQLIGRLKQIFLIDGAFNEKIFTRQMAVLRGQFYNIVQSLKRRESPAELLERPFLAIESQVNVSMSNVKGNSILRTRDDDLSSREATDRQGVIPPWEELDEGLVERAESPVLSFW